MARNSLSKRNVRKLGTIGNTAQPSYYVTLPIEYVRKLGWRDGQNLKITKRGSKLTIEDN